MTSCGSLVPLAAVLGLLGTASAHGADSVSATGASLQGSQDAPSSREAVTKSPGLAPARETASPEAGAANTTETARRVATQTKAGGAQADGSSVDRAAVRTGVGQSDGGKDPPRDPLAAAVIDDELAKARGGAETPVPTDLHINQNNSTGTVTGNVASQLTTGSNTISDGAFANSAGIPIVIQNSGNNVLIQNSTILNLQLTAPK